MSNVTLQIGGRGYTVACADGEEAHIAQLGRAIADKVEQLGNAHGEARQLLFASLLLADELHEARGRPSAVPAPGELLPAPADDRHADLLEELAERLEKIVLSLEG